MRDLMELLRATRSATQSVAMQNQRAGACVDGIFDVISELNGAADRSDWQEVRRLAELILMDGFVYGVEGSPEELSAGEHGLSTHFAESTDTVNSPVPMTVRSHPVGRRVIPHRRKN